MLHCNLLMLPRYFEDPESAKQCNVLQYTWCVVIYVTLQNANAPQVLCVQRKVHSSVLQYTWCVVIYVTLQPANAPQVLCVQRKVHSSVLQYTWSEPTCVTL